MIPSYALTRCEISKSKGEECTAAIDLALSTKFCDSKTMNSSISESKEALESAAAALKSQIAQASEAVVMGAAGGA